MNKHSLVQELESEVPLDKYIVFMYVVLDYSKSGIAEALGIDRKRVNRALERNIDTLQKHGIVMPQDD